MATNACVEIPARRPQPCQGCGSPAVCHELGCAAAKRSILDGPIFGSHRNTAAALAELHATLLWANEHRATGDDDHRRYASALARLDEIEACDAR